LCSSGFAQDWPIVAGNGDTTLVAWIDDRTPNSSVYGTLWRRDGGLSAPAGAPLSGDILNIFNSDQQPAAIAKGQSTFFLAWPQRLDAGAGPGSSFGLFGTLVSLDGGTQVPPFQLVAQAGNALQPSLTFDGLGYVLAWTDQRTGENLIHALRIGEDGGILTPDFTVSPLPDSMLPAVGTVAPGATAVTYQRYDSTAGVVNLRTELRLISAPLDGGTGLPDGGPTGESKWGVGCGCQSGSAMVWLPLLAALWVGSQRSTRPRCG
jgi:hypothetical protein